VKKLRMNPNLQQDLRHEIALLSTVRCECVFVERREHESVEALLQLFLFLLRVHVRHQP
jgi:hypothetical protein